MSSNEVLIKDISDRMASIQEATTPENLRALISTCLEGLSDDDPVVRKFRAGSSENAAIKGSKFSRYGLTVEDIELVHDITTNARNVGLSSGPSEELDRVFKEVSEAVYMSEDEVRRIDQRAIDNLYPRIPKRGARNLTRAERQMEADRQRAMDTAESGYGAQLVGAQYVRDMWEASRAESRIFGLIDSFEMMDATTYIPVEVDIPEMIYVGENVANNSSEYSTVKTGSNRVSMTASKFVIHQMWSGEMEEDSIIPFVAYLRRQAQLSIAHYSDSLVLNGDTTNTATGNINLDDADPADTKHYLAQDGIRHAFLVDNTANGVDAGGAIELSDLANLRTLMMDKTRLTDFGHPTNANDLIFIADPETADQIAMLDEFMQQRIYNGGTFLSGEVARALGHPVISSMAMSKTEADGKVSTTAGNNIYGQVAALNPRGIKVGWRRRVKVETERLPARDQNRIVWSLRMGIGRFTPTGSASGIEWAAGLYNIDLT